MVTSITNSEAWIESQEKYLIRWIKQKNITKELKDLSQDLSDGIILNQLLKSITRENIPLVNVSPKSKIQKLENLVDIIEFCTLILNVNLLNISAENIYEGNIKLILGMIWCLFRYDLSITLRKNPNKSFFEIKQLLMQWVNGICNKKSITITNFDIDWSIERYDPTTYLFNIVEYYLPGKVALTGKRFLDLKTILLFTDSLGIRRLIEVEDFKFLVPNEYMIVNYIAELFNHFCTYDDETNLNHSCDLYLDNLLSQMITTIRMKKRYDNKYIRAKKNIVYSQNMLQKMIDNIEANLEIISSFLKNNHYILSENPKGFTENIIFLYKQRPQIDKILDITKNYQSYKTTTRFDIYNEILPALDILSARINENLKIIHPSIEFWHITKCDISNDLMELEKKEIKYKKLLRSTLRDVQKITTAVDINGALATIQNSILGCDKKQQEKAEFLSQIEVIEYIINLSEELYRYSSNEERKWSVNELRSLILLAEEKDQKFEPQAIDLKLYQKFKKLFNDRQHISKSELLQVLSQHSSTSFGKKNILLFMNLISNLHLLSDTISTNDKKDCIIKNSPVLNSEVGNESFFDMKALCRYFENGLKT